MREICKILIDIRWSVAPGVQPKPAIKASGCNIGKFPENTPSGFFDCPVLKFGAEASRVPWQALERRCLEFPIRGRGARSYSAQWMTGGALNLIRDRDQIYGTTVTGRLRAKPVAPALP
jgi:hypothetical protein